MVYGPNEFFVSGDTVEIVLPVVGGEPVRAVIDSDDVARVLTYGRWYRDRRGCVSFGSELTGPRTSLHTFIVGATRHQKVAHKNGDLMDNRKSNLVVKGVNDAVVEDGVARVEVTRQDGSIRDWFLVDAEDLDRIRHVGRWHVTTLGYINSHDKDYRPIALHRFLLDAPKGRSVDHINGDKKDNRKSNLRIVNQSENAQNSGLRIDSSSGVRGVTWSKSAKMWRVKFTVARKSVELGYYKKLEDATRVANEKRIELFPCCPERSGR